MSETTAQNSSPRVIVTDMSIDRGGKRILSDVNLTLDPTTIYAIVGPNGAGKTTLLDTILGFGNKETGHSQILGSEPPLSRELASQHLGIVSQDGRPFSELTVEEFIHFASELRSYDYSSKIDQFGLSSFLDRKIKALSGGEAKRLELLVNMGHNPSLLILDEPTTGLDPVSREILWEEIRRAKASGATVVLVTHYIEEIQNLADELIVIKNGTVEAPRNLTTMRRDSGFEIIQEIKTGTETTVQIYKVKTPQEIFDKIQELKVNSDTQNTISLEVRPTTIQSVLQTLGAMEGTE